MLKLRPDQPFMFVVALRQLTHEGENYAVGEIFPLAGHRYEQFKKFADADEATWMKAQDAVFTKGALFRLPKVDEMTDFLIENDLPPSVIPDVQKKLKTEIANRMLEHHKKKLKKLEALTKEDDKDDGDSGSEK